MRILIKILLSFVLLILSLILSGMIKAVFAPNQMVFLPSGIVFWILFVGGLIGIWRYKPNNEKIESSDDKEKLDKTL
ncbi:MAG: hypothetical protein WCH34_10130 [Bacteroidota bacterium]